MRIIGVRSHRSGHRRVGSRRCRGVAVVAMLGLAGSALPASGPVLTKRARPTRAPIPTRTRRRASIKAGHRHHAVSGDQVHAGHPSVRERLRRPLPPQVHREQRRRHLQRGDLQRPSRWPRSSTRQSANEQELEADGGGGRGRPPAGHQPGRADVFLNYFNKVYELYGRHVVIKPITATGNYLWTRPSTRTRPRPVPTPPPWPSRCTPSARPASPTNCRAGAPTRSPPAPSSRSWSSSRATPTTARTSSRARTPTSGRRCPRCTNIAAQMAEVIGKELAGKKAIYAGGTLKTEIRKFGTFIPNINSYIGCNGSARSTEVKLLTTKYHVPLSARQHLLPLRPRHLDLRAVGPAGDRAVQGGRGHHASCWPATPSRSGC